MSNQKLLSEEQILEARNLSKQMGLSKYELARRYDVSPTTIFYSMYGRKRRTKKIYRYKEKPVYVYLDINGFFLVVKELRKKGLTSGQIAMVFNVPVEQINLIWCKTL